MKVDAADRVLVALDVETLDDASALLDRLAGVVTGCKIGSQLFTAAGPVAVEHALKRGFRVFLDLKYHDIPNTVAGAVREATHPSSPASRASRQRWRTCPSTDEGTPSSRPSAARSRLVSTVTAITSGRRPPASMAAAVAASAAARIMAPPPEAWTLNMNTPRRAASRAAPATVLGMSWYLRSRKTSPPRLRTASMAAGPEAVKS